MRTLKVPYAWCQACTHGKDLLIAGTIIVRMGDDVTTRQAQRATDEGLCILGGKLDDITVCVARVKTLSM